MNYHNDYYSILGISKSATKAEIKAAFRKLAVKYHPDKNPGNAEAEEKFKEINEAHEVLYNDITRAVYDEYQKNEEKVNREEEESRKASGSSATTSNRRTYEKKTTIRKERKIYVKGTISAKFWAEQEERDLFIMKEVTYRVNPVEVEATINQTDIHPLDVPRDYQRSYQESEIFKSPIPQPVKCKIVTSSGEEFYDLVLKDVRIKDPILSGITKYDKQSLGTLTGDFWGYVTRIDEEEHIEPVTECFGETGNIEKKAEDGSDFYRKEYYHKDCTTYWGPWEEIRKNKSQPASKPAAVKANTLSGCTQWWWIPALLLLLIIAPQFALGILGIGAFFLLASIGLTLLQYIIPVLALLFMGVSIYNAFQFTGSDTEIVRKDWRPQYDTLKTTREPIPADTSLKSSQDDTLISHFIAWKDYDSNKYEITLSILASDVRNARNNHIGMDYIPLSNTLAPIYDLLERQDSPKLERIFYAFDSIRGANNLTEVQFSSMVVSCIQAIPYYLVLDVPCSIDFSEDEFTYNYLRQCDRDCCLGGVKFGVQSPVEFVSNLKGDCDTRSLLIYAILKRFDIDVAILSSLYYKHALIAVHFKDETNHGGVALNINGGNYYLWETTGAGFQPGQIPPDIRNLDHWSIALLNRKNN